MEGSIRARWPLPSLQAAALNPASFHPRSPRPLQELIEPAPEAERNGGGGAAKAQPAGVPAKRVTFAPEPHKRGRAGGLGLMGPDRDARQVRIDWEELEARMQRARQEDPVIKVEASARAGEWYLVGAAAPGGAAARCWRACCLLPPALPSASAHTLAPPPPTCNPKPLQRIVSKRGGGRSGSKAKATPAHPAGEPSRPDRGASLAEQVLWRFNKPLEMNHIDPRAKQQEQQQGNKVRSRGRERSGGQVVASRPGQADCCLRLVGAASAGG